MSSSNYSSSSAVQSYPTDAQGLFQDNNPQIIRRPAPNGNVTYTQNIRVRFLQPPPVPPPGVSIFLLFIILTFRLYSLSSSEKCDHLNHRHHLHFAFVNKLLLFLNHGHLSYANEHQYNLKASLPRRVSSSSALYFLILDLINVLVIRRLAALPVPPRSVIIERLPAAPPRPRDIIIERWVPYGAAAKRRTIVQ